MPTDQTLEVIRNVAKWFIKLEQVTVDKVGSLSLDQYGAISVGPVITHFIQTDNAPFYHGPFPTAKSRYLKFFDTALEQILAGTRTLPKWMLMDFLTALELKSLILSCSELDDGPWYIKHGEDKGDHFMVDDDGEITGVIDWDW